MAVTITTPDPTLLHPAYCGDGPCVCFEDAAFITGGSQFSTTLTLGSLPSNNDDFLLGGVTWVFKTVLTGADYEIKIEPTTTATAVKMALAFRTLDVIDDSRFTALAIGSAVVVASLVVGTAYALTFVVGTAPVTAPPPALGTDPVVLDPWALNARVMYRPTSDPALIMHSLEIRVTPLVLRGPDGSLSYTACLPVGGLVAPSLNCPFPDLASPYLMLHTPVAEVWARWSLNGGAWATSSRFNVFQGRCAPLDGAGYAPYSPGYAGGAGAYWLNHVTGGETFCQGSHPVFYAAVGLDTLKLTITFDDPLSPVEVNLTVPPHKWGVLYVNPTDSLPPGYAGPVSINLTVTTGGLEAAGYLDVNYTVGGDCGCRTSLTFLNDFGVFEAVQCGPRSKQGVEVSADTFITCPTCGDGGGSNSELRNSFAETFEVWTDPYRIESNKKAQLISLLTSPEVWMSTDHDGVRVHQRVTVQRGGVVLVEKSTGAHQLNLKLTMAKKTTNSNI